jgi:hypothetical protein
MNLKKFFLLFVWVLFLLVVASFYIGSIYMCAKHKLDPADATVNFVMMIMLFAVGSFCVSAFANFTNKLWGPQIVATEAKIKGIVQADIDKVKNAIIEIEKKL